MSGLYSCCVGSHSNRRGIAQALARARENLALFVLRKPQTSCDTGYTSGLAVFLSLALNPRLTQAAACV